MPGDESQDDQEDVRARLAAEPAPSIPPEVAERIQVALETEARARAGGSADPVSTSPASSTTSATVTPLQRRGRWKAPLLAAAGVVAVVAVAVPVVNQLSGQSDDAGSSSTESAPSPDAADSAPSAGTLRSDDSEGMRAAPEVDLTRASFAADVRAALVRTDRLPSPTTQRGTTGMTCSGDVPSGSEGRSATLDGDPALVVASAPSGSASGTEVRALVCDSGDVIVGARTVLPPD